MLQHLIIIKWQGRQDLNPQPAVLETAALPVELLPFARLFYSICAFLSMYIVCGPVDNFILELLAQVVKIITVTGYTDDQVAVILRILLSLL